MYRRVAIVKPDHIGDLVLAAPAISWITKQCASVLFVQSKNLPLAGHLFPALPCEAIDLEYLTKDERRHTPDFFDALKVVADFDLTVFLRSDHLLNRDNVGHVVPRSIFTDGRSIVHETRNHQLGIRQFFGDYRRDEIWQRQNWAFSNTPEHVGLCIGSGFPANKWSIIKWAALSTELKKAGISVTLIGGAGEKAELDILAEVAGVANQDVIIGGGDIDGFLRKLSKLNVVIASDGGSGHLCSLATSVLTIAGSVPFRRFSPFGAEHRTISLDLPCSPCLNAHDTFANGCFSYECSYGIQVDDVLQALYMPAAEPGSVRELRHGAKLFYAPSHAAH